MYQHGLSLLRCNRLRSFCGGLVALELGRRPARGAHEALEPALSLLEVHGRGAVVERVLLGRARFLAAASDVASSAEGPAEQHL